MSTVPHQDNITNVCATCNVKLGDCIVRGGKFYCDESCFTYYPESMVLSAPSTFPVRPSVRPSASYASSAPSGPPAIPVRPSVRPSVPPSVPPSASSASRTGGCCANCRNSYKFKINCIDAGSNWFCGKTCQTIYRSGSNVSYPATIFPFASNTFTVFPLRVNPCTGAMTF